MGSPPANVTGVILAGGLARRMGAGVDKALLPLAGRPLLAHVLERLAPQVERVVISANGDPERFAAFGLPILADQRADAQGPLAGLEAALATIKTHWILSVAVDLPFLPNDLAAKLGDPLQRRHTDEVVVATSASQCHYVVALWPRSVLPALTAALTRGQRSLHEWFRHHPHRTVPFSPTGHAPDPFFNINCPTDLQVAEALYREQAAADASLTGFTCYRGAS
ncbi:MAG: molybdenum cofactor guanylyltransferase [Magnetococcales bacterium]|nr:molybdenum cofactor guanylyltransferase [Magnetococcales bacterium]